MNYILPLLTAFSLVFLSELGDKTQLLVLSFSTKLKTVTILLGVALGSLLSHGVAILFGSFLGNINNSTFQTIIKLVTYFSFIFFGIITLLSKENYNSKKNSYSLLKNNFNYIFMIALSIAIGELGDKTFLASLGLGIKYYNFKLSLIMGAILGMVTSDLIAIIFGKIISKKLSDQIIKKISGILFILFGLFNIIFF